jgi:hypothetical protein
MHHILPCSEKARLFRTSQVRAQKHSLSFSYIYPPEQTRKPDRLPGSNTSPSLVTLVAEWDMAKNCMTPVVQQAMVSNRRLSSSCGIWLVTGDSRRPVRYGK